MANELNVHNHRAGLRQRLRWSERDRLPLMADWFNALAAGHALRPDAARELRERGFVVLPGLMSSEQMKRVRQAYDAAAASAAADDVKVGSTTTRVDDFVNRGAEFDALYVFPPLLEACCYVIGRPFKLSSLHARTLRPHSPVSDLHVDVRRNSTDWPLVGFIVMIDDFRPDNGATRFVPGSHQWPDTPEDVMPDRRAEYDGQLLACGTAGSLLVFDGSAWHGHTANSSDASEPMIDAKKSSRVTRRHSYCRVFAHDGDRKEQQELQYADRASPWEPRYDPVSILTIYRRGQRSFSRRLVGRAGVRAAPRRRGREPWGWCSQQRRRGGEPWER